MEIQGRVALAVSEDRRPVTVLTRLPRSPFEIGGEHFVIARERTERFSLSGRLGPVANAELVDHDHVSVNFPPHRFDVLLPERNVDWEIRQDGRPIGSCRVKVLSAEADLPSELPLSTRVFLFYIAWVLQKGYRLGATTGIV